ncbi:MAG: SCP2 sterol-binding domain-containing protein [Acidimicrobiales bacterium]
MTDPGPTPAHLSDAWLAAATTAVAGLALPEPDGTSGPGPDGDPAPVVIGYDVADPATGEPGPLSYRLVITRDVVRFVRRHPDEPGIRFRLDESTAAAVASGSANAQRAVLDGRIVVTGDPRLLLRVQETMAAVETALTPLRPHPDPPQGAHRS